MDTHPSPPRTELDLITEQEWGLAHPSSLRGKTPAEKLRPGRRAKKTPELRTLIIKQNINPKGPQTNVIVTITKSAPVAPVMRLPPL